MDRMGGVSFDRSKLNKAAVDQYSSSDSDSDDGADFQIPSVDHGADEFLDHNPRKRRRTGRDAKESAALGIFGSESEDDGPGSRWKHKNLRHKGVAFVSSSSNKKDAGDDDDDDDDEDDASEVEKTAGIGTMRARVPDEDDDYADAQDDSAPTAGLGLGSAAQRVAQNFGWSAGNRPTQAFNKPSTKKTAFNPNAPLGSGFVPTSSFIPELKVKDAEEPPTQIPRPSAFSASRGGTGGRGGTGKINADSFGARMMAKMGYKEGTGLGKEGQGRNVIIEANLRPQRAGLGVVREKTESERQEEKRQARLRGEIVVDSDEEEKKRKAARKKKMLASGTASTPGSGTSTPKRQKQKYFTMDEAKKAAPGLNIPDAFTPILDLTGPGRKMLTTSSGLMTPTGSTAPAAETAEQAETRKLARRAQNQFMAILEEWRGLQERRAYSDLQLQQETQELDELEQGLSGYKSTVDQFARISLADQAQAGDALERWSRLISSLKAISDELSASSRESLGGDLASITVAALHPAFKDVLQTWDPLEDAGARFAADLDSIKTLLGIQSLPDHSSPSRQNHHRRKPAATPYETMIYQLWLPHVARAVREWNVRESDQMLALFATWSPLLPSFVRSQLLEQDIVRKLDEAVGKWEPKRRKHHTLPHMWLFPWLQFLPARHLNPRSSTGLVADVKRKFRQLVDVWEFDRGMVPGLAKWKAVLGPSTKDDQWRPLLMSHVLPSMARYLRKNFEVDPSDQAPYVPMLTGTFAWLEVVSASALAEVIVAEVFPKWHERLYQWLTMDSVDYIQVMEWLEWWRDDVFPPELKQNASIVAEFDKGERTIELGTDLGERSKAELPRPERGPALVLPSRRSSPGSRAQTPVRKQPPPAVAAEQQQHPASFRQQVEDWCQAHDLQFMPERTKVHSKGPLYRVTARADGKGGLLVYFEDGALRSDAKEAQGLKVRTEEDFFVQLVGPGLAG